MLGRRKWEVTWWHVRTITTTDLRIILLSIVHTWLLFKKGIITVCVLEFEFVLNQHSLVLLLFMTLIQMCWLLKETWSVKHSKNRIGIFITSVRGMWASENSFFGNANNQMGFLFFTPPPPFLSLRDSFWGGLNVGQAVWAHVCSTLNTRFKWDFPLNSTVNLRNICKSQINQEWAEVGSQGDSLNSRVPLSLGVGRGKEGASSSSISLAA